MGIESIFSSFYLEEIKLHTYQFFLWNKNYSITIANVCASRTLRVKYDPVELEQLCTEVVNVINDIKTGKTTSKSLFLIAGELNARARKRKDESCIGSFSRGEENSCRQMLTKFCP